MNVPPIYLLMSLFLTLCVGRQHPIRNYELMRPLQYFFYLLEMKAEFNPMLGSITVSSDYCSSKSGPFCRLTGHEPFQTHGLRETAMNEEVKNVRNALRIHQKQTYQSFQEFMRQPYEVFFIRNEWVNQYESALKKAIGDRMHQVNMLPTELFETLG